MTNSVETVFSITELLEVILLELPAADILFAQAIDRHFRDTIKASTPIQQKLFFIPSSGREPSGLITINPLLTRLLRIKSADGVLSVNGMGMSKTGQLMTVKRSDIVPDHATTFKPEDWLSINMPAAPRTGYGSWRQMLVADPPCEMVLVEYGKTTKLGLIGPMSALVSRIARLYGYEIDRLRRVGDERRYRGWVGLDLMLESGNEGESGGQ